jgi:hypothetical protein
MTDHQGIQAGKNHGQHTAYYIVCIDGGIGRHSFYIL